ncbi:unnamed protein product, partial [Symbiodinium sp. KB8]
MSRTAVHKNAEGIRRFQVPTVLLGTGTTSGPLNFDTHAANLLLKQQAASVVDVVLVTESKLRVTLAATAAVVVGITTKILIMLRQLLPPPLTMIMVFIFMKQWKLT